MNFSQRSPRNFQIVQNEYTRRAKEHSITNNNNNCQDTDVLKQKCLEALFVERRVGGIVREGELVVTMDKFGKILDWFGPLCAFDSNKKLIFLDKITQLLRNSWFHGDLNTKQAETLLSSSINGTFLIRFSTNIPGIFTISKKSNGVISHQRILHPPGSGFCIDNQQYDSVDELVMCNTEKLNLTNPCHGSPYSQLFKSQQVNYSGYILNNSFPHKQK